MARMAAAIPSVHGEMQGNKAAFKRQVPCIPPVQNSASSFPSTRPRLIRPATYPLWTEPFCFVILRRPRRRCPRRFTLVLLCPSKPNLASTNLSSLHPRSPLPASSIPYVPFCTRRHLPKRALFDLRVPLPYSLPIVRIIKRPPPLHLTNSLASTPPVPPFGRSSSHSIPLFYCCMRFLFSLLLFLSLLLSLSYGF